ncbi:MAG: cysteine peptidase family C39 domain-containing protein [Cyclobacteriaceae bacterium]
MEKTIQFPFYQQENSKDDGRACLRMISRFYGKENNFSDLGQLVLNKQTINLLDMTRAAEEAGFKALVAPLTFDKLKDEVPLPAICHLTQGKFVVVHGLGNEQVYIADPSIRLGLEKQSEFDFRKNWSVDINQQLKVFPQLFRYVKKTRLPDVGIALLLEPTPDFFS